MKVLVNSNLKSNESLKKLLDNINAFLIKNKNDSISFDYHYCSSFDDIKDYSYIILVIDNERDLDKYNKLIKVCNKYLLNNLVVFMNEDIDFKKLTIDNTFALIQAYINKDELYYYVLMLLLLTTKKKKYTRAKIDKLIKDNIFNIDIKKLIFFGVTDYKDYCHKLYTKYIKMYLDNEDYEKNTKEISLRKRKYDIEFEEIVSNLNDFIENSDFIYNKLNKGSNKNYLNVIKQKIEIDKMTLLFNKLEAYKSLVLDYYCLAKYYKATNNKAKFDESLNIGYAYAKCIHKFGYSDSYYAGSSFDLLSLHFDINPNFNRILNDLNKLELNDNEVENTDHFSNNVIYNILNTLYYLCNYRLKNEKEASYYYNKLDFVIDDQMENPFDVFYECSRYINPISSRLSLKFLKYYVDNYENEAGNLDNMNLPFSLIILIKDFISTSDFTNCYKYIDLLNNIVEKEYYSNRPESLLLSIQIPLLTAQILNADLASKKNVDFHVNLALERLKMVDFESDEAFIYLVLFPDLDNILNIYDDNKHKAKYKEISKYLNKIIEVMNKIDKADLENENIDEMDFNLSDDKLN